MLFLSAANGISIPQYSRSSALLTYFTITAKSLLSKNSNFERVSDAWREKERERERDRDVFLSFGTGGQWIEGTMNVMTSPQKT